MRKYNGYRPDLVIESDFRSRDQFFQYFDCEKFWVELELENPVPEDKLDQLKEMLSHKWLILIMKKNGTFEIHKPCAWEAFKENIHR